MPVTFVTGVPQSAGTATTCTFALPGSGISNNDTAYVFLHYESNTAVDWTSGATDNWSARFTLQDGSEFNTGSTPDIRVEVFAGVLQASDAGASFIWHKSGGGVWREGYMVICRGGSTTQLLRFTNPAAATSGSDATIETPAETGTTTSGDLVIWSGACFDDRAHAWPATADGNTITERYDVANNLAVATAPYGASSVSSVTITISVDASQWLGKTIVVPLAATTAYRDATFRIRSIATAWRDAVARIRSAVQAFRDATLRARVDIRGYRDAVARARVRVTAWIDARVRVTVAVQAFRDATARLEVATAGATTAYRDAVSRIRLRIGQVSHPTGDQSIGNWTTDTGATTNLYQRVDEADRNDSDYVQSGISPVNDTLIMPLEPLVDPGGNAGLRMRVAIHKNAAGGAQINLDVVLQAGTTDIATGALTDLSATASVAQFTLTASQVDDFRTNNGFADPRVKLIANQV